jgi:hypothetical protein
MHDVIVETISKSQMPFLLLHFSNPSHGQVRPGAGESIQMIACARERAEGVRGDCSGNVVGSGCGAHTSQTFQRGGLLIRDKKFQSKLSCFFFSWVLGQTRPGARQRWGLISGKRVVTHQACSVVSKWSHTN